MPSREEERNLNKKSDIRYCSEHENYYYAEFGCQQCAFVNFKPNISEEKTVQLKKCLKCKRISLFWNSHNEIYECLNKKCKGMYTRNQVTEAEEKDDLAGTSDELPKRTNKGGSFKKKSE